MRILRALVLSLVAAGNLGAYAVLTHQAIIDSAWDTNLKPYLQKKFPNATDEDLKAAHSYAYGGSIIQDMGYYPFGSKFFSDLTHYVRSGDFVETLLKDAQDLNETAFALGALAHYASDNSGHPLAVNTAVAAEYPKLRAQFGPVVTYADNPTAHLKIEFGFDVLQVASGRYAPEAYHDFIGFHVAKPLLDRAFEETYGLKLSDVFTSVDLALGSFRHAVSSVIPEMTRVAWNLKKDELQKAQPGITKKKFIYNLSRASYQKEWDGNYEKPGAGAKFLSFLFRIVPKVGPFKSMAFKAPTPETEKMFMNSFNKTLESYRTLLVELSGNRLDLRNTDFDTGKPTAPGEYKLADNAYAELVRKLGDKPQTIPPAMRADIMRFYGDVSADFATKKDEKDWQKTLVALDKIKASDQTSADRQVTPAVK